MIVHKDNDGTLTGQCLILTDDKLITQPIIYNTKKERHLRKRREPNTYKVVRINKSGMTLSDH